MNPLKKNGAAHQNTAKSNRPISIEEKERCASGPSAQDARATVLKLILPPHSACLANEDRQAFYHLYDSLAAKYRPADDAELALVRQIADLQWKINRNKQMESAIFNRELVRQGARISGSLPELRDLEISIAAQEALTGNRTIAELRRDTQQNLRAINQIQRRLLQLQKAWPATAPTPPTREINELDEVAPPQATAEPVEKLNVNGPVTENVVELYRQVFHKDSLELVGHQTNTGDEAT